MGIKSVKSLRFGRAGEWIAIDGNCFFRCISFNLTGSEDYHKTICDQVVKHISTIHAKVKGYLDEHPHIYISESGIENEGIWAIDKEIMTTSNLLECDIIVYTLHGNATKKWLTYPANFSLLKPSDKDIYLDNVGETHYDVVLAVWT